MTRLAVEEIKAGIQCVHSVGNQIGGDRHTKDLKRVYYFDCEVLRVMPQQVRVRFKNGAEKTVLPNSLWRKL